MKKVFVIIVTYKGKRWYDKCFASLRESTFPVQTVVIDNTPGEEDAEYIKSHYPEVHLIKPEENLGFGKANNLGMRYALDNGCDYVFLLNQDAWIESNTIGELVRISTIHTDFGIISPMHMYASMDRINMAYYDHNYNYELVSDLYCGTLKEIYPMRYVNAAAWLLPRKTLEIIGGFCPMIFMYGEDDDYLNRVAYHKIGVCICPTARIVHDTIIKLDESLQHYREANAFPLSLYLDISKDKDFYAIRRHLVCDLVKNVIKCKKSKILYYFNQYMYLIHNQKEIVLIRDKHKQKLPHWL